jgi:peptidoglycan/xylan/chitin deacetylase (PgdA/CDA1 family)
VLNRLKLELAYFGGQAWQSRAVGGAGVILRFERVIPRRAGRFQPFRASEITPRFLTRTVRALKRWRYDFVTMDEACRRAVVLPQRRRFVCLTFDGAYKDVARAAYPILAHHRVPFMVYVPTAFPDGVGEAWWLALEKIIAKEPRVSLMIDRTERHFGLHTFVEKNETFDFLTSWLRQLAPPDLSAAINDLCKRYSVDLPALTREAMMDWEDLSRLAADPLVTFGCATVNYPVLSNLRDADALRISRFRSATAIRSAVPMW